VDQDQGPDQGQDPDLETLPIYAIVGHGCIPREVKPGTATSGDSEFPSTFNVPRNTFLISFSDPGSYTCFNKRSEQFLTRRPELSRQFLYLHGADEFVDHQQGSKFARAMRATGWGPGHPIPYPNISISIEPDDEGASRATNEHGVFDVSNPAARTDNNLDSIIPQCDRDKPITSTNRNEWTLHDIIKRVYQVTGNTRAIFLLLFCFITCSPLQREETAYRAEALMRNADLLYRSIKPVLTRHNMTRRSKEVLSNITHTHSSEWNLDKLHPSQLEMMLKTREYNPTAWKDLIEREIHPEDKEEVKRIIKRWEVKQLTEKAIELRTRYANPPPPTHELRSE
jgi:hypothetical protein